MADFRRQTPAGELQISVAEITEAADPLGPRLETPLVFSIARFPFAKRKSSFPIGEPEVRIHLPPAVSPVRTTGSGATFAMGRVARREMILRSKRYPRVDRVVCSMALDTD
jgi:hypothetical protein